VTHWIRIGALAFAGVLAVVAAPARAGDAQRGEQLYVARCGACHAIDGNGAGPQHRGLFGRRAGSVPGFAYSDALRRSGIVWNVEALDRWLANPNQMVPGNKMVVQLANESQDRADIIDYLGLPLDC
jgi:cytochrome c